MSQPDEAGLDGIEAARALLYRMLAHVLAAAPDAALLGRMAGLHGDGTAFGQALDALAAAAAATAPAEAGLEYDALFIGVTRGELLPYASFYLTGFLHERPLARLRADLARLGVAVLAGRSDPEDHIATVCDVMATLIEQRDPEEAGLFARHLAPWGETFFADLEHAASARLYRPVGTVGRQLVALDRQAFDYAGLQPRTNGAA